MAADTPIGTRIKKRRQVLDMTQQDLADALRVSKSTVANWESGKHFPLRYLGKVEAVLEMSFDDGTPTPPISPESQEILRRELGEVRFREVMTFLEQQRDDHGGHERPAAG